MEIIISEKQLEIIEFMIEKCEDWNYDYFDNNDVESLENIIKIRRKQNEEKKS